MSHRPFDCRIRSTPKIGLLLAGSVFVTQCSAAPARLHNDPVRIVIAVEPVTIVRVLRSFLKR